MKATTVALLIASVATVVTGRQKIPQPTSPNTGHYLYVAVPGTDADVTNDRAVGILVFDIDNGHQFVRRISPFDGAPGKSSAGEQVRGISTHISTRRLYLSTVARLAAIDLATERVIWEKSFDGHCCDRVDVSPDGRTVYAPAFGKPAWYVINALDGQIVTTIGVTGFPRQTIYSRDGKHAYLAAWESRVLSVVDTSTHKIIREVGPFSSYICPFTMNGRETLAFANVDGLVGFEVGDLRSGLVLDRVVVEDSNVESWEKYECPSHGIAMTSDDRELWIADGVDNRIRIFDSTMYPPVLAHTIDVTGQPRWIAFSLDATYAYTSRGEVIDRVSRKVVARLEDEHGALIQSERMVEVVK